nr:hypothetical protein [Tanacetum cinerariifolium]
MTTQNVTSSTDSQMHNNIMAAGSRILRYVDTRPNGESLKKCILSGPYKPTTILVQAVDTTDDSPAVPEHTTMLANSTGNVGSNRKVTTSSEGQGYAKEFVDLIAKYFKKIYKPTNNNLRTSSNSKNKNVDTTLRFKNDNQSGQFGNQSTVNVAVARENVGSKVVQQSGIQCFNCREFGHFAKECRKPKRVKDSAYHKEKMLMCKQAEQGVPLQAE